MRIDTFLALTILSSTTSFYVWKRFDFDLVNGNACYKQRFDNVCIISTKKINKNVYGCLRCINEKKLVKLFLNIFLDIF